MNPKLLSAAAGVGTSHQPRTSNANRHRILLLLVALALGVSLANLAIGQRANNLHQLHQQQNQDRFDRPRNHDHRKRRRQDRETGRQDRQDELDNDNYNEQEQTIYDGETITKILKGEKPFPQNNKVRLKYRPGTLQISHAEALQHCFINVTHYHNHIADRPQSLVSLSDKYKIIYRNIPKSSSSSSRHAMMDYLEGGDNRMKHDDMENKVHNLGYAMISFVREPMSRFYSSYDEAFFRMGPWMGKGPIVRDKPRVRQGYLNSKYRIEKYPYLYEGFETIEDFRKLYCPHEVLKTGHFLDCNEIPSIDDGTLAHRFEQFVRDYSGLDPFDIHLNMQISNLVFPGGEPFPMTALYNATEAEKGWQEIASKRGVTIPDGDMTHGRKITRRFNVSKVSDETKRKICRILALDYCCLNIELPSVCRDNQGVDEDEAVYCAMEKRDEEKMKYALEPLVIHTWKDP